MASQNTKLRFAVIGCGHIGKRHAEMISRNPHAQLVALCDNRPKDLLGLDPYHHIPFFHSLENLLNDAPHADVINICTPNGLHAPMAIRALETGHHVVIEKPMATSVHDAEMILHTSKKYHRQVFCVMQNRYSPPSLWLKQIVDSGLLGQIYIVQLNCYWNRDQRYYQPPTWHGDPILDGGTLFTQFSHFIDILYWVFGDILPFHARFSNFNHPYLPASSPAAIPSPAVTSPLFEDSGIVSFNFLNSPAIGTFSYSTSVWDKNMESSLLVIAQNGSLKIGGQYMNQVDYCHIKDYQLPPLPPTNPGNDYGPYKGSAQNHHHVIRHVIQTLSPTTHTTLSPQSDSGAAGPLEGLKVVDIIHRIYRLKN